MRKNNYLQSIPQDAYSQRQTSSKTAIQKSHLIYSRLPILAKAALFFHTLNFDLITLLQKFDGIYCMPFHVIPFCSWTEGYCFHFLWLWCNLNGSMISNRRKLFTTSPAVALSILLLIVRAIFFRASIIWASTVSNDCILQTGTFPVFVWIRSKPQSNQILSKMIQTPVLYQTNFVKIEVDFETPKRLKSRNTVKKLVLSATFKIALAVYFSY